MNWKLSITTTSNVYADAIMINMNKSDTIMSDDTLKGGVKGRFVTLRSERLSTLLLIVQKVQLSLEFGSITRVELSKESGR